MKITLASNSLRARWWTAWAAWALILGATAALWVRYPGQQILSVSGVPGDFSVYYRAWERVSQGVNPYQAADPSPYKYSPGLLSLMQLVPPSSPGQAWFVFGSLSLGIFALALLFGARYRNRSQLAALFFGLVLGWKGILETLDYGQVELLIFGLAVLATAMLRRGSTASGLLAGTLPWIKLPWGLLILPMLITLVTRRAAGKLPRFFSGYFAACFLWGAALPALVFGPERAKELSQAWVAVLRTQPSSLYLSNINQSLWVSIPRWISPWIEAGDTRHWLLALGFGAVLAGLLMARLSRRTAERSRSSQFEALASVSPWLLLTQLLNPLSWRWGSVFVVGIPFAALEAEEASQQSDRGPGHRMARAFAWTAVAALWLLQQNPVVNALGYAHWADLHGWGLITLFWLGLLALSV